jgi:hypothetical protein
MSFTDRYITVPIRLIKTANESMGIPDEGVEATMKIHPTDVCRYYELTDNENIPCIKIHHKDGDSTLIYLTMTEFENLLNKYYS